MKKTINRLTARAINAETGEETKLLYLMDLTEDDLKRTWALSSDALVQIDLVYLYDYGPFKVIKGDDSTEVFKAFNEEFWSESFALSIKEIRQQGFHKAAEYNLNKILRKEISAFNVDKLSRFNEYVKVEMVQLEIEDYMPKDYISK